MSIDVDKIERIILNLISNAIKLTNDGGTIYCAVKIKDNKLIFYVEDNGIFNKFTKVDNTIFRNTELS